MNKCNKEADVLNTNLFVFKCKRVPELSENLFSPLKFKATNSPDIKTGGCCKVGGEK